jgi:phosphoserine/homoserine phosphotransferase
MDTLPGATDFVRDLREKTQFVILSDTFEEFAKPLMAKLGFPTLFCNSIEACTDGTVSGYVLRQQNAKKCAVSAFKTLNFKVFAVGDSFNDLAMIMEADKGCLFRAPENIRKDNSHLHCVDTYEELMKEIECFLYHSTELKR